jgi:hypothetical protein
VVDDDISQRADGIVEVAAVLDSEVLRHRDLNTREVVATPQRLEDRVREAQMKDLLEAHLPEVVVDPVQLRLVDVLVQFRGEVACGLLVVPERLLDDDPGASGQSGLRQTLDHPPEQEGRCLQVEDRFLGTPDGLSHTFVRAGVGEIAADV